MHNLSKLKFEASMKWTWFLTVTMILPILQYQVIASSSSSHLSRSMQKVALFQFKLSLAISTYKYCYPLSPAGRHGFTVQFSHPKTMNWSMSSECCTWDGVTCEPKTGDIIGLDLSCSRLVGTVPPNSTLFQLSHLQFLNLSGNYFSGSIPLGISHLYKLVSLDLSGYFTYFELEYDVFTLLVYILAFGVLPQEVFHLPNLEVLYLSDNNLTVILPKAKWGSSGSLQRFYLENMIIDGGIPDSIAYLRSLTTLHLVACKLVRTIPRSISNLTRLTHLNLEGNDLTGQIPIFITNLTDLRVLRLTSNNFTGLFPSWVVSLGKLSRLYLSFNALTGPLPSLSGLIELPSLTRLFIDYNRFTGQLNEFNASKSSLQRFACGVNFLHGPIPQSFLQLVNLNYLHFSSNNFSGVLDIELFSRLKHLEFLFLDDNSLSVRSTSMATVLPKLHTLSLSSCNLKEFPYFLKNAKIIKYLDLSNNQIVGEIPHWIRSLSRNSMYDLNLSHNSLTGGLEQLPWNNVKYLNLQSNMFNGSLPSLICNLSTLGILDLSQNNLSGALPVCPKKLPYSLSVLDLRMNNIQGNLPSSLSYFLKLRSLNLHGNKLEGRIPPSFAEFDSLETLDLGRNQINDTFPHCLEALPNLHVLVLKSNKFNGLINNFETENPFPSLRIIDLSHNLFSGPLPAKYFNNFKAMMYGGTDEKRPTYMGSDYYYDHTEIVIKGVEMEVVKISIVFTTIDVSSNNFEGEIVETIGNLVSLKYLNLSHNRLTGHIPSLLGKLSMLESLDLSFNRIEGDIPQQLTNIYTLARLNLSHNQLSGHIPQGSQFNTFDNDSYVSNLWLCGRPLSKECENGIEKQEAQDEDEDDDDYIFNGFTWKSVVIGYGCGVVPAFIMGYLMLLARKPKWFAGIIARELGLKIRRIEIVRP